MFDDIIKDTWGAKIASLKDLIKVQAQQGNWDYDPYMHGMLNGMILSLSVMTGENPEFFDAPKEWGCDRAKRFEQGRIGERIGEFNHIEFSAILSEDYKNEQKETK